MQIILSVIFFMASIISVRLGRLTINNSNPQNIGMTFGGGSCFGHGKQIADSSGTAQFTILSYEL